MDNQKHLSCPTILDVRIPKNYSFGQLNIWLRVLKKGAKNKKLEDLESLRVSIKNYNCELSNTYFFKNSTTPLKPLSLFLAFYIDSVSF